MVVDELIAYLKERMYAGDALFSTLVLDRFFRILSDSKYLFSINADGSFVLSLIFFKMIEALRIKEVDQMIESLQKEIARPAINTSNIPIQTETPSETPTKIIPEQTSTPHNKTFNELVEKIKDRNAKLGKCFEMTISFVSYDDSALTWESCADEECKKVLTHGYSAIKQLVREVFGFETKIKHQACSKAIEVKVVEPIQNTQSASMIEDTEMGGSASCVTNCESADSTKEIDAAQMKDEPMVVKAVELFEAKKMTIQSKI
jgi:DNA polymerase-3 subunit gamma/tau